MCERVADKQRMLYRGVTMNFAPQSGVSVVPAGPPPSTLEEPLPDIGKRELACLDLAGNLRFPDRQRLAWADFRETVRLWRLPVTLAWLDIKTRYRGSVLGPFWLTLSTGVMVAALGVLYARLFQMNLREYLPFIALSLVLWGFLQSLVNDGCVCFTLEENMIRSIRMPFSFYAMRCVLRNLFIFAHNVVVIVAVFALLGQWPRLIWLLALPSLLLWLLDAFAVTLLLGPICARFRDVPPIINNLLQIAFFITPIIWKPELIGPKMVWLPLNPFYALVEIVRAPLLDTRPDMITWAAALGYSAAIFVAAWFLFVRVRGRIAFWI
jgi:lipopolysaccharide transport system permease protein